MKKYRVLLSFDFEAAVRLKQWDTLKGIVFESATIADEKLYSVFADIALCSEAPLEEMVVIFKVRDCSSFLPLSHYMPLSPSSPYFRFSIVLFPIRC